MRVRRLSAGIILLLAGVTPPTARAADAGEMVDAPTLRRILHLNNIAACLDAPALMVTDLDCINQPTMNGEELKGPPRADAETVKILELHADQARSTYLRVTALFFVGAMGGESENQALVGANLCRVRARLAWAKGNAAATLSWLEQAADRCEKAYESLTVSFDYQWNYPDLLCSTKNDWTKAVNNAYSVRLSCEALGYDLSNIGKQPRLHDGSTEPKVDGENAHLFPRPQRFTTTGLPARTSTVSLAVAPTEGDTFCKYLRLQKASACLSLPGMAPACIDYYVNVAANQRAPSFHAVVDDKTKLIVVDRRLQAISSYRQVKILYDAGAKGGGKENRSLAARRSCQAEATTAWADGDVAKAADWLGRAVRWSEIALKAADNSYDQNEVTAEFVIAAQNETAKARLALQCFQTMSGQMRSDLPPTTDRTSHLIVEDQTRPKPKDVSTTPIASAISGLRKSLISMHAARSLDLPPLIALHGQPSAVSKIPHALPVAEAWTIDELLNHTARTTSDYRRVFALHQVGAMGGEDDIHARIATELCLSRARLEWSIGEAGMTVAWLDQAVHWSRVAVEKTGVAYQSGAVSLDAYMVAMDNEIKARLAALYVRTSCESLGHKLDYVERAASLLQDAANDADASYFQRITDKYKLVEARDENRRSRLPMPPTDTAPDSGEANDNR